MKKYLLHVQGTHCSACKMMIEETLTECKKVSTAKVDLVQETVEIMGKLPDNAQKVIELLNPLLEPHKYRLSLEKVAKEQNLTSLFTAIPIGLAVLTLFFFLQKSGLIDFGFEGDLTPWTALLIGLIASVSTCLAVVGGLILSLSAEVSQSVSNFRPFSFFHAGRLLGFMVLGGILGALGNAIGINNIVTSILGIIAAIVMIILGINLIDTFPFARKLQLVVPKGAFSRIIKIENGFFAPFLIGTGTFFLPCGFTQSMQIAALASGSWIRGSIIMTSFALGTLPMLILITFSSYKFAQSKYAAVFFKSAGIIVLGLGLFALLAGMAGLGIIMPVFNI